MKKIYVLLLLSLFFYSCTKEVPETEKKLSRTVSTNEIKQLFENFTSDVNSNNLDKIDSYFEGDFSSFVQDADSAVDLNSYKTNLVNFQKQYPSGKLQTNIEDIFVSEELAAAQVFVSYMINDPVEKGMNPVYSERSIKLLRKSKTDNSWKIFRSLSTPAFSYDN